MIKKLLALMLSLMLAFGFAGCSSDKAEEEKDETAVEETEKDNEKKEEEKEAPEADAKKTAVSFLDAFVDFDYEGLQAVVDNPDEVPEEFKQISADAFIDEMGGIPAELADYETEFKDVLEFFIDSMKNECTYNLNEEVEEKDGNYVFTGTLTIPDFKNIDFDSYIEDQFNEATMEEILTELANSGAITEETTEEELIDIIMTAVLDALKDAISDIDYSENLMEKEFSLNVVKDGDKWVVNTKKSDYELG